MIDLKADSIVIQIGTNDGADVFNQICRMFRPMCIILVEPNKSLSSIILKNYSNIPGVFLESVAITPENKGIVKLYLPTELSDKEKIKANARYADAHYSLRVPTEYYGVPTKIGREIEAPSMTFEELCAKYNIKDIDYLQTDAEGCDGDIIRTIDFDKHNIKYIQYESWVDWKNDPTLKFLESKGYAMQATGDELNVLAIKI